MGNRLAFKSDNYFSWLSTLNFFCQQSIWKYLNKRHDHLLAISYLDQMKTEFELCLKLVIYYLKSLSIDSQRTLPFFWWGYKSNRDAHFQDLLYFELLKMNLKCRKQIASDSYINIILYFPVALWAVLENMLSR